MAPDDGEFVQRPFGPREQSERPPGAQALVPAALGPNLHTSLSRNSSPPLTTANASPALSQSSGESLSPSAEFHILGLDREASTSNSRNETFNHSNDGLSEGIFDTEATENVDYGEDEDLTSVIEHLQSPLQSPGPGLQRVTPLNSMTSGGGEPSAGAFTRLGPPIALPDLSDPSITGRTELATALPARAELSKTGLSQSSGEYIGLEPGLDPFLSTNEAVASGSALANPQRSPHRRNRSPRRAPPEEVGDGLPQLPPVPDNIIVFGKPREVILSPDLNEIHPAGQQPVDRNVSNGSQNSRTSQNSRHSSLNDSIRSTAAFPPSALKQPPKRSLMTEGPSRPLLAGIPPVPSFPAPSVTIENEKYDQWGRRQCSLTVALLLLLACLCFPPFWLLLGAGIFDSFAGAVPRRVKQAALVLGAGALAASIALSVVFCLV